MEATIHAIHQKAKQATVQGLGQEIPVKFSHLYSMPPCDHIPWNSGEERRPKNKSFSHWKASKTVHILFIPHPLPSLRRCWKIYQDSNKCSLRQLLHNMFPLHVSYTLHLVCYNCWPQLLTFCRLLISFLLGNQLFEGPLLTSSLLTAHWFGYWIIPKAFGNLAIWKISHILNIFKEMIQLTKMWVWMWELNWALREKFLCHSQRDGNWNLE